MKLLVLLFIVTGLMACGGAVDNSEPPAELVEFSESATLTHLKEIETVKGSALYTRISPLNLDKHIVFSDTKGIVTVFDKAAFEVTWQKKTDVAYPTAIGGDSSIYLFGTRGGEVIALDSVKGDQIWRVRVSSEVLARPAVSGNTVVVKTIDGQLTALDAKTGNQKWIFKKDVPALSVRGNSAPLIVDDKIITGLDSGKLVIVDLNSGKLFWEKTISIPRGRSEIDRLVDLDADIILNNSIAYVGGFQGRIVAIDLKTGDTLWVKKMSIINNMTFENNKLYITDVRSHVWAIDATTGATIWKLGIFTSRKLTSPVIMNDYLLLGDYQGYLHVISKSDGHQISRLQIDDSGVNVNPIVINDSIYLQSRNSKIHAVKINKLSD